MDAEKSSNLSICPHSLILLLHNTLVQAGLMSELRDLVIAYVHGNIDKPQSGCENCYFLHGLVSFR